jgi:hypothetical protein
MAHDATALRESALASNSLPGYFRKSPEISEVREVGTPVSRPDNCFVTGRFRRTSAGLLGCRAWQVWSDLAVGNNVADGAMISRSRSGRKRAVQGTRSELISINADTVIVWHLHGGESVNDAAVLLSR